MARTTTEGRANREAAREAVRETTGAVRETAGAAMNAAVPNLEPFFQASNKLIETWMVVGTEILEFSRSRIDQNLEMSKAMARSSSFNEALDLQQKFTRMMMQDYLSEASKLADIGTRSLLDSFATIQKTVPERGERAEAAE